MTHTDGAPYFPSNGTEGDGFLYHTCKDCIHDACYRKERAKTQCDIIFKSLCGERPKEWIYQDGDPMCTAFKHYKERKKQLKKYVNTLFDVI